MDAFVDAFLAVDESNSGTITTKELQNYVKKNNLEETMVERWQTLFDPDKTGEITLEKFCDVLGLKMADIISKREEIQHASKPSLGSDIHVIVENMNMDDQIAISNESRRAAKELASPEERTELTQRLKKFVDAKYGPSWQVMIVDGSYWITFTHVPENCFHFNMNEISYLFWKISD